MNLVHCCRCGRLYEEGEGIGIVMEDHLPEKTGFIGGICGCGLIGPRRDGVDETIKQLPEYRKGMWYVDWIAKRIKSKC